MTSSWRVYSPLATGKLLKNGEVAKIAGKYGSSVAQLSIRYVLGKGALPLPKVYPSRVHQAEP
ncbi:MAG: hypothetical protein MZV63_31440 [Marinilabiliales bacterium]|nr:hypothetical protein [Marinilabiliales bacterium]